VAVSVKKKGLTLHFLQSKNQTNLREDYSFAHAISVPIAAVQQVRLCFFEMKLIGIEDEYDTH